MKLQWHYNNVNARLNSKFLIVVFHFCNINATLILFDKLCARICRSVPKYVYLSYDPPPLPSMQTGCATGLCLRTTAAECCAAHGYVREERRLYPLRVKYVRRRYALSCTAEYVAASDREHCRRAVGKWPRGGATKPTAGGCEEGVTRRERGASVRGKTAAVAASRTKRLRPTTRDWNEYFTIDHLLLLLLLLILLHNHKTPPPAFLLTRASFLLRSSLSPVPFLTAVAVPLRPPSPHPFTPFSV